VAAAITVHGLGKRYRRPDRDRTWTLQQAILAAFTARSRKEYFWSLRDVSFTVERGRMCGIVGRNGAGKSTLLRLLGGVSVPDEGTIAVRGRVGGLLELTAGFHGDLTGRENVIVGGVVRGLRRHEVLSRFSAIVEFAELAAVIDHPLRTYSTGMQMRLAFAVAIHCEPDVLLVDEVLAVGDLAFQRKCLDASNRLKAQGVAIVVVSHDLSTVATMCDEAVYLRGGMVVDSGAAEEIVKRYEESVWDETIRLTPRPGLGAAAPDSRLVIGTTRFGSMEAVIDEVGLLWLESEDRHHDRRLRITVACHSGHAIEGAIVGLTIVHQDGRVCYDTSSEAAQITVPTLDGRIAFSVEIVGVSLDPGQYYVDVGLYERSWNHAYDYHSLVYPLVVTGVVGDGANPEDWKAVWSIESPDLAHAGTAGESHGWRG
jgi:lipopolysaccharide transport system ATP-binding protein